jgi:hypothetical protein
MDADDDRRGRREGNEWLWKLTTMKSMKSLDESTNSFEEKETKYNIKWTSVVCLYTCLTELLSLLGQNRHAINNNIK